MTRKKRERRDYRRILQGLLAKSPNRDHAKEPPVELVDVDDPSFPPNYTIGFKLIVTETMALLRRPFAFIKFGLFFYLFYLLSMMFIAYLLNGFVSLQGIQISEEQQILLNMTFLEIAKLLITPAFLLSWLAATWVFRRGAKVEIKWISEVIKHRTLDLIVLGVGSVLFVGLIGYITVDVLDGRSKIWPFLIGGLIYLLFQYYIHQIVVIIWDSGSRPWQIATAPFKILLKSWKMALGMLTGLLLLAMTLALLFMTLIGIPALALNIPVEHMQWVGLILLPLFGWGILQWQAIEARLLYLLYLSQAKVE